MKIRIQRITPLFVVMYLLSAIFLAYLIHFLQNKYSVTSNRSETESRLSLNRSQSMYQNSIQIQSTDVGTRSPSSDQKQNQNDGMPSREIIEELPKELLGK